MEIWVIWVQDSFLIIECLISNFWILFSLLIEFVGVTMVNKIIQVSGAQFYNSSSVPCIVCLPPQVKSPSVTIYPLCTLIPLPSHSPLTVNQLWSITTNSFSFFFLFSCIFCSIPPCSPQTSTQMSAYSPSMSLSLFCLLVSSFCSLDSTYEWNHTVLVFFWLAHFT